MIATTGGWSGSDIFFEKPLERIAEVIAAHPEPVQGRGRHQPDQSRARRRAGRERGQGVRLRRRPPLSPLVRQGTGPSDLLPVLRQVRRARDSDSDPDRPLGAALPAHRRQPHDARPGRHRLPRAHHRRDPHRLSLGRGDDLGDLEAPQRLRRAATPTLRSTGTRRSSVSSTRDADRTRCSSAPTGRSSTSSARSTRSANSGSRKSVMKKLFWENAVRVYGLEEWV